MLTAQPVLFSLSKLSLPHESLALGVKPYLHDEDASALTPPYCNKQPPSVGMFNSSDTTTRELLPGAPRQENMVIVLP